MKLILLTLLVSLLTGCTGVVTGHEYTAAEAGKVYTVGKAVYKVGKVAVKASGVEVPDSVITADKVLVGIDGVREEVKKTVTSDYNKTK